MTITFSSRVHESPVQFVEPDQTDARSRHALARAYEEVGELAGRIGSVPEALEAQRKALDVRRALSREAAVRILLINPPYQTLTSNWGVGHQVPLGLLAVGGPLLDAGHKVRLLDAECRHLNTAAILRAAASFRPDVVMTGHAGSTPAHPTCVGMLRTLKAAFHGFEFAWEQNKHPELKPLVIVVKGQATKLTAQVIVANDSSITKLEDLKGQPLPVPGTPVLVMYLDDEHYEVL